MNNKIYALLLCALTALSPLSSAWANAYFWTVYDTAAGLPAGNTAAVAVDPGDYVWAGTRSADPGKGGIRIVDPAGELATSYDTSDNLPGNVINGIAFESIPEEKHARLDLGAAWIATNQGIGVLSRKGACTALRPDNSPLPGSDIAAVSMGASNAKWISVWGKGISCVDSDFHWSAYTPANGLCSTYILSILEDSKGAVWFGSQDNGLSCLGRDGSWNNYSAANTGLAGNCVRAIAEDSAGRLWFVTTGGISVFDGRTWMSYTSRNSPLGNFIPSAIAIEKSGTKWIGTEQGGVFKFDSLGMWTQFYKDNSALPDNKINALALDSSGTVWLATPAGLCSIGTSPRRARAAPFPKELQQPPPYENVTTNHTPFEYSIVWENIGVADAAPSLSFALPSFFHGAKAWYYAAFWTKSEAKPKDFHYSIAGDRRGNMRLKVAGGFSNAMFLACGSAISFGGELPADKKAASPFPLPYPEELEEYLLQGEGLPVKNPEIQRLAQSLIRPSSRGDMYKTARDIVYSRLIQHAGLDERNVGLLTNNEPGEEDARLTSVKDVFYVIKNKKGDSHSKARLICTLARAAGIPARIVMSLSGKTWSHLWIAGAGWIPVEASYPVFDYVRPERTCMPKAAAPEDQAIAAVSGRNDDTGRVMWNPQLKAYYADGNPAELKDFRQLSRAKLLLMNIAAEGEAPEAARIEIGQNIFVLCRQQEKNVMLVLQDKEGREIKAAPLVFDGLSCTLTIENRLFWKFVPQKIGSLLVLENLLL